jgi:hypothetical protein
MTLFSNFGFFVVAYIFIILIVLSMQIIPANEIAIISLNDYYKILHYAI